MADKDIERFKGKEKTDVYRSPFHPNAMMSRHLSVTQRNVSAVTGSSYKLQSTSTSDTGVVNLLRRQENLSDNIVN